MPFLVHADKPYPLADGGELVLGRHGDCGVQISDEKSSRRHARVYQRDGGWWVEDLASANGTKLNGRALITGPARLADGDRISIGQAHVSFQLGAQAKPARQSDEGEMVGHELGGHRLDTFLGRGLTGPLYRAWCEARERNVMVKVLDRRLYEDRRFVERFQRQLTLAAGIEHPGVVRIYQSSEHAGVLWYSMELIEGETLAQRLQEPVKPYEALSLTIGLAEAIQAYHDTGLVHGDVKPQSVMFDRKGVLHLLDIGLIGLTNEEARLLQADGATRQVFYLCPAQAKGGQCNVRSDIYSIGCILFHLLAGRPPYIGSSFTEVVSAHERQPVPAVSGTLDMPAQIDEVLAGMMHKDPSHRYEAIGFAITALKQVRDRLS
jgi:serine/threonine-protein kinase